jgi:hypothetical protein
MSIVEVPVLETVIVPPPAITTVLEVGQGPAGPPGASGAVEPAVAFAFGDATPRLIGSVAAGQRILSVEIAIDTPFNGTGASLSLGTLAAPGLLAAAGQVDPAVAATYELAPQAYFAGAADLYLFITPGSGASAGGGSVSIQRQ